MNKPLKYALLLVLIGFVGYNSVYFKRLDDLKAARSTTGPFNAGAYANTFWTTKLLPATTKADNSIPDLNMLITSLKTEPEKTFDQYSHALGIGNIRYFLVKGQGIVSAISPTDITVSLPNGTELNVATEYIFGNAARDASGLIQITEFSNTTDLNNVAAEVNEIIRKQVIPGLKATAKTGQNVQFVGAIELNRAHLHIDKIEVIPITIRCN